MDPFVFVHIMTVAGRYLLVARSFSSNGRPPPLLRARCCFWRRRRQHGRIKGNFLGQIRFFGQARRIAQCAIDLMIIGNENGIRQGFDGRRNFLGDKYFVKGIGPPFLHGLHDAG